MFPFKTQLSLQPLIKYMQRVAEQTESARSGLARSVLDMIEDRPELMKQTVDIATLEKHRDVVVSMLDVILPWSLDTDIQIAVTPPLSLDVIYATPEFERLNLIGVLEQEWKSNDELIDVGRTMDAYHRILGEVYGVGDRGLISTVVTVTDEEQGLDRGFKISFDPYFSDISLVGKPIELNERDRTSLQEEGMDPELWKQKLPPEKFLFSGFMVVKAIDVTEQHMLSLLREDLLHADALSSTQKLDRLQQRIRSILRRPELRMGLFYREQGEDIGEEDGIRPITRSLLLGTGERMVSEDECDSPLYRRVRETHDIVVVNDLEDIERSDFEDSLLSRGIRNLALVPLEQDGELIGVLEIGSPKVGDIHQVNALKIKPLVPLFSTTVTRIVDEQENYIQAIIKEHYTAIHPAVEWRFREAAKRWMKRRKAGLRVKPEHIVFNDVFSLYGLSDIRGSSDERNLAIQTDLLEQLRLAHAVIVEASSVQNLPVLDEVGFRIVKAINEVEQDLHSGDDFRMLEFLGNEVEELFPQLERFGPDVAAKIEEYTRSLDPRLGTVYRERKDYEESVMLINDAISSYIERQEERAQGMFPHYFEKFKTDGVDYNLYVGASLQKNGTFDRLYLVNLRIWQLMMTCGIAHEIESIRPELKKPLEVAHLILVQDIPIAIRFRIDEKQFDVDGAYNIRYEIVKKRIDKAEIRGRDERLTQPNKVAIVYSQDKEAAEYRRYIEYLQASGYLEPEVEDLELEDLQGVHGLRALRVSINMKKRESNGNGAALDPLDESVRPTQKESLK